MRRCDVVAAATAWLGTPYHHQAATRGVGCDCLGLVRGLWRELVGPEPEPVPPYTPDWAEGRGEETLLAGATRHFVPRSDVRAGSILVFRWRKGAPAKHAGVALSETRFCHAYDSARRVVAGDLAPFWSPRLVAVFDFPGVID